MADFSNLQGYNVKDAYARERVEMLEAAFVTPQMFGAKGDGVNDDTISIQNAMDALMENGGGVLHFPSGTYNISETLIIRPHTKSIEEGNQTIHFIKMDRLEIKGEGGAEIKCIANMEYIIKTYDFTFPSQEGSFSNFYTNIDGMKFNGNNLAENGVYLYNALHSNLVNSQIYYVQNNCIYAYGYGELSLQNNVLRGGNGIELNNGGDCSIHDNDMYIGDSGFGLKLQRYSGSTVIEHNTILPLNVRNNDFVNESIGVLLDGNDANTFLANVYISHNSFDGLKYGVMCTSDLTNKIASIYVSENKFTRTFNSGDMTGVYFKNVTNSIISDNNFGGSYAQTGAMGLGVKLINSNNNVITNNIFIHSNTSHIELDSSNECYITSNEFIQSSLNQAEKVFIKITDCYNDFIMNNLFVAYGENYIAVKEYGTSDYNNAFFNAFKNVKGYERLGAVSKLQRIEYAYSAPTDASYLRGDVVLNMTQDSGVIGWVCKKDKENSWLQIATKTV